jgi:hypothetical protein
MWRQNTFTSSIVWSHHNKLQSIVCGVILLRNYNQVQSNKYKILWLFSSSLSAKKKLHLKVSALQSSIIYIDSISLFLLNTPACELQIFLRHVTLHGLRPVWLYRISRNYLVHDTISGGKKKFSAWNAYFDLLHHFHLKRLLFHEEFSEMTIIFLGVHLKCLIVFSIVKHTWKFSIEFNKSLQHKTSRKSIQWDQTCSMRTDMLKLSLLSRCTERASKHEPIAEINKKMIQKTSTLCMLLHTFLE